MCTMYQQTSQWTGYFWQIYFALFWHLFLDIFVSFCSTPHHTIPCLIQINLILQFFFYFDVSTYTGPHGGRVVFACRNSNYTNGESIVRLFVLLIAAINLESENSNAENRIWCNRCCQSGVKKQQLMFWMLRRIQLWSALLNDPKQWMCALWRDTWNLPNFIVLNHGDINISILVLAFGVK